MSLMKLSALCVSAIAGTIAMVTPAAADILTLERVGSGTDVGKVSGLGDAPVGGANLLAVVEIVDEARTAGAIRLLNTQTGLYETDALVTIDLGGTIGQYESGGIQSFAASPNFATDGKIYVSYTDADRTHHVVEYTVTNPATDLSVDPTSARTILSVPNPTDATREGHYGGWIGFNPNGGSTDPYLYVTIGDREVPLDNGTLQNPAASLYGSVLRIDPTTDSYASDPLKNYGVPADNPFATSAGLGEVFAYGFRNPFSATFRDDGTLIVADVGEDLFEEINTITAGGNYGWPAREGFTDTGFGTLNTAIGTSQDPAYAYGHGIGTLEGFAVISGPIYDGDIEALKGMYVFADFVGPKIFTLDADTLDPTSIRAWELVYEGTTDFIGSIVAIALGEDGFLYASDNSGRIARIINAVPTAVPLPAAWALFLTGAALVGARRRRAAS